MRVVGRPAVLVKEEVTEVLSTEKFQIHCQKSRVVNPVDIAQPIVELETIQQGGPLWQAEDVLTEQVAVAVDNAAVFDPLFEQVSSAHDVLISQPRYLAE